MELLENNYFEKLFRINVNDKIEKKNGLNYLSWSYAWAEVKKLHPTANYKIYETETGCIYHTDGKTCWVKTGVIIEGIEHIEYLPVMDYKNKSIPVNNVTSFDVNKAIQRSLTKAVARHGLGLYVYAGEDLPEQEPPKNVLNPQTKSELNRLITEYSTLANREISDISKELINLIKKPLKEVNEQEADTLLMYLNNCIAKAQEQGGE